MDSNLIIAIIIAVLIMGGILYAELDRKDKEIRQLEVLNMNLKAEVKFIQRRQ